MRRYWVPIALVLALVAGGVAFAAMWPGFAPQRIDVRANTRVSRADVIAAAGIAPNVNIWLQNPQAIATRVEAIPYVSTASVHRIPPATIQIDIVERTPFAVVRSGSGAALVDRGMRVLEPAAEVAADTRLVRFVLDPARALDPGTFLTDPEDLALRDDYDAMLAAHVVPLELRHDRFGGLVATLSGGIRLMLGTESDLDRKLVLVDPILAQVARRDRSVDAIDLRAPGTPVIDYKN